MNDKEKLQRDIANLEKGIESEWRKCKGLEYKMKDLQAQLAVLETPTGNPFESWLRVQCFQAPTKEAYSLAKSAWHAALDTVQEGGK